jgi:4'-phosphopantetheinyl transferase
MSLSSPWPTLHEPPVLTPGAVHVWRLKLDLTATQIARLRRVLTDDERVRADRFHAERHRHRFIACRAQVRQLLAGYLKERPEKIDFRLGSQGKPALGAPWSSSGIHFNVSNSHDMALCAIALQCELGVDIEHVREGRDHEGLAARFFAPQEIDALRALSADRRTAAFFNCWTRKEAVLKAVGIGIAFPLDRLVVTLAPSDPARVVAFDGTPAAAADWWLEHLEPAPGYVGALAAEGDDRLLFRWTYEMQEADGLGRLPGC